MCVSTLSPCLDIAVLVNAKLVLLEPPPGQRRPSHQPLRAVLEERTAVDALVQGSLVPVLSCSLQHEETVSRTGLGPIDPRAAHLKDSKDTMAETHSGIE